MKERNPFKEHKDILVTLANENIIGKQSKFSGRSLRERGSVIWGFFKVYSY